MPNEGADSSRSWPSWSRRAARVLAANQVSPRHTVAVTRPNAIQPSARLCTSVKPSQKARPVIARAGCANSSSDRSPGTIGTCLAAVSEGGSNRFRGARRSSRFEAAGACPAGEDGTAGDAGTAGEEAEEAGAEAEATETETGAAGATAGQARPRLLDPSTENPAPA